jgi:hypothetical protein
MFPLGLLLLRRRDAACDLISSPREIPTVIDGIRPKVRFAPDCPLEGDGFEPSVPHRPDVR